MKKGWIKGRFISRKRDHALRYQILMSQRPFEKDKRRWK